jgi:hypothetical protein
MSVSAIPGVKRCLDLADHLADANQLFAIEVATALGRRLVFQLDR